MLLPLLTRCQLSDKRIRRGGPIGEFSASYLIPGRNRLCGRNRRIRLRNIHQPLRILRVEVLGTSRPGGAARIRHDRIAVFWVRVDAHIGIRCSRGEIVGRNAADSDQIAVIVIIGISGTVDDYVRHGREEEHTQLFPFFLSLSFFIFHLSDGGGGGVHRNGRSGPGP